MSELQPYQQRVVEEKTRLDERLLKLRAFLNDESTRDSVGEAEWDRLTEQEYHMQGYSDALAERVRAFGV